jgi:copper resistance protein B
MRLMGKARMAAYQPRGIFRVTVKPSLRRALSLAAVTAMLAVAVPAQANELPRAAPPANWFEGGFDLAEMRVGKGGEIFAWESAFSYGSERNRAILEFEGAGEVGRSVDEIEATLFYARGVGGGVTLLGGVRHEFRPQPYNTYAVVGAEAEIAPGVAVHTLAFLSEGGHVTGEGEVALERAIAPGLLADARASVNWSAQAIPLEDTGAGLTEAELSLRLRYQLAQRVAPYVGVIHGRLLGETADIARSAGDDLSATHFVVGLSFNFGPALD